MIVVVEDSLSEVVVRKLVAEIRPDQTIATVMRKNGRGYIQARARDLNRTANTVPVMIVVDLDRPEPCPADLIASFLETPPARNLLFRVAVMEIESWVLADRKAFSAFLGVPEHRVPSDTDAIAHPKETIVNLARKSRRREICEDMVPRAGGTAAVGPAFNAQLGGFVSSAWDPARARVFSPSLSRAIERLRHAFR